MRRSSLLVVGSAAFPFVLPSEVLAQPAPPLPPPRPANQVSTFTPAVGSTLPEMQKVGEGIDSSVIDTSRIQRTYMEATDFAGQDVQDVLRAIAKAYGLNVFIHPDVKGKVTLSLHRMPVQDALRLIAESLGDELIWENQTWQVRPPRLKASGNVQSTSAQAVNFTAHNKEIRVFAEEYSQQTNLNLLVDRNAKGVVNGTLKDVDPITGLKAFLSANGFSMRSQDDAWIIMAAEGSTSSGGMGMMPSSSGRGRMDISVRNGKVQATLRQAQIGEVIQSLADQSNLNMVTYGQLSGTVDANLHGVPLIQALELILQGTSFTFAVHDSVLLIGDRNPSSSSGQALSTTEIYYLKHMRVDKVLPLMPKNLQQAVQAVSELNALLLSGTTEMNDKVKEFLTTIDREVPQVVIEAVIVEFYRTRSSQMGIKSATSTDVTSMTGPAIGLSGSLKPTEKWSNQIGPFQATMGMLPQNFLLQIEALENSDQGRVLARPRLTTLNGQAASINVGTSDYYQVTTTDKNGVVSSDYRAFSTGITLSITPYLTQSGQITAEIKPEVKTPLSTSSGSSDNSKPPGTSTRSLSTNVRLRNGETLVLGGLIQTIDLINNTGVPLLSAIPFIGKLFTYKTSSKQVTELAIFITPRVQTKSDSIGDPVGMVREMDDRVNGWKNDIPFREPPLLPQTQDMRPRLKDDTTTSDSSRSDTAAKPVAKTPDATPLQSATPVPSKSSVPVTPLATPVTPKPVATKTALPATPKTKSK